MKGRFLAACLCPLFLFAQTGIPGIDSLLNGPVLSGAHTGISVYDPQADSFLIHYQADKLFVPASNTKLFTLYAALKYLDDSIPGLMISESKDKIRLLGTGDPTFLNPHFSSQKIFDFLKNCRKEIVLLTPLEESFRPFGDGWSMDDFDAGYAPERSRLPIYGNVVSFTGNSALLRHCPEKHIDANYHIGEKSIVRRALHSNQFELFINPKDEEIDLSSPFIVSNKLLTHFLSDTLHKKVISEIADSTYQRNHPFKCFYSLPADTLLRMMMFESDNFLAEQSLLMSSATITGKMSDTALISTLLSGLLKEMPQKPRWVDGSGLSRYNLFSPNDLVYILNKMENEFSFERLCRLLPSGGSGTLSGQFISEEPYVYGKTGSMGNISCFSGFLKTAGGRRLIFSLMINNLNAASGEAKKARQSIIDSLRKAY
jgi:D-alanyl-D-alanine carboxypeptidase/D-alanyl-D-alanine-endopeptidase (penicillin-binding protein 4)